MSIWWLAISKQHTSYNELKGRKVVAQGWPKLGNLVTLLPLVSAGDKNTFINTIKALEQIAYGATTSGADVLWTLLNLRAGDVIVGVEGIIVKGICELKMDGWDSYRLDEPDIFEYAQTIEFGVEWVDWDTNDFGPPPTTPAPINGVAGLRNESQRIITAWEEYKKTHPTVP